MEDILILPVPSLLYYYSKLYQYLFLFYTLALMFLIYPLANGQTSQKPRPAFLRRTYAVLDKKNI